MRQDESTHGIYAIVMSSLHRKIPTMQIATTQGRHSYKLIVLPVRLAILTKHWYTPILYEEEQPCHPVPTSKLVALVKAHPAAHPDAPPFQGSRREGARDAPAAKVNGEILALVLAEIHEAAAEAPGGRQDAPLHDGETVEDRARAVRRDGPHFPPCPEAGFGCAGPALQREQGFGPLARNERRRHHGEAACDQLPLKPERAGKHMREAPPVPVEAGRIGFVTEAGPGQEGRDERPGSFQQAHVGRLDIPGARKGRAGGQQEEQGQEVAQHGCLEALHGGR